MLSEEELSASAASHRDFLLQTLHNVRNQLANPSPLIVSGLAVQEEPDSFPGLGENGSIHMPKIGGLEFDGGENSGELQDGSAGLILKIFDMIDRNHNGSLKKLDFLSGIQKAEVQNQIRHHPQFSALIHSHSYRDAFLQINTENDKFITVKELIRFAKTL